MALLTAAEIKRIEKKYADGISSRDIVDIFQKKGERFSEPTLRKYVQLGLLPKSRRVGIRGKHRGSSGLYPVIAVRLINQIKKDLNEGATLEEIRLGTVGLSGEVQALHRASEQVLTRFKEAVDMAPNRRSRDALRRTLTQHKKALTRELKALDKLAERVGRQVRS